MKLPLGTTAAILLREFGEHKAAREYARRMAQRCDANGAASMANDYAMAANDLDNAIIEAARDAYARRTDNGEPSAA